MKKVCILAPENLPIPAVRGGAVETLIDLMVDGFQIGNYDFSLDVISVKSKRASLSSKKNNKVNYHYVNSSEFSKWLYTKAIIHFYRPCRNFTIILSYLRNAIRVIRKNEYDVIIVENRPLFIDYICRYTRSSCVLHQHNVVGNAISRNTSIVIAVSNFINSNVRFHSDGTVPIVTVYNAINTKLFQLTEQDKEKAWMFRREMGFADDDIILSFVGRLIPEKGVDKLISAYKKANCPNLKLLFVGSSFFSNSVDTPFIMELKDSIKDISGSVFFTGYVSHDEIKYYYHISDFIAVPSQCEEALLLVSLEAQASSKPIIVTDVGGVPEGITDKCGIILHNDENIVDSMSDAIKLLYGNQNLRKAMGESGLLNSLSFDSAFYFDKIVTVLRERALL